MKTKTNLQSAVNAVLMSTCVFVALNGLTIYLLDYKPDSSDWYLFGFACLLLVTGSTLLLFQARRLDKFATLRAKILADTQALEEEARQQAARLKAEYYTEESTPMLSAERGQPRNLAAEREILNRAVATARAKPRVSQPEGRMLRQPIRNGTPLRMPPRSTSAAAAASTVSQTTPAPPSDSGMDLVTMMAAIALLQSSDPDPAPAPPKFESGGGGNFGGGGADGSWDAPSPAPEPERYSAPPPPAYEPPPSPPPAPAPDYSSGSESSSSSSSSYSSD